MTEPRILPFPQTKKALRHYSSGMDAAGVLSLLLLERDGKPIPSNVQRFDEPKGVALPDRSAVLMLVVLILETLTTKQRERVRRLVRTLAYSDSPQLEAVQLHNLLSRNMLNGRS